MDGDCVAVSMRSSTDGRLVAYHSFYQEQPSSWCMWRLRSATLREQQRWSGHSSSAVLTRGAFLRIPSFDDPFFLSGDERTRRIAVWSPKYADVLCHCPDPFPNPILQLAAGEGWVAAACHNKLRIYNASVEQEFNSWLD